MDFKINYKGLITGFRSLVKYPTTLKSDYNTYE